jgi:hypothetical protein
LSLLRGLLALAVLVAPALAGALEPRFDHRDTHGPFVAAVGARDTVALSGGGSASTWRPAVRLGWGLDLTGEGNEVLVGAAFAIRSYDDPERERVLLGTDARYRAFFGTEELKTFFDVGVWVPTRSRLAVGPLVALGLAYDFSRAGGVSLAGSFATAFGQARVASFEIALAGHLRFEMF